MHQFLKFIFGIKLYMFRTVPLSIIRSFSLYTQQWYLSYRFADSLRAGSLILLASCTVRKTSKNVLNGVGFYVRLHKLYLLSCNGLIV